MLLSLRSPPGLTATLVAVTVLAACTGSTGNHQAQSGAGAGTGGGTSKGAFAATVTVNGAAMCPLGWDQSSVVASGSVITVEGGCGSDHFTLTYAPTPAPGGTAPATQCSFVTAGAGSVTCPGTEMVTDGNSAVSVTGTAPADLRVSGGCECAVTTPRPSTPCPAGQVPGNGTCVPSGVDGGSDACPAGYSENDGGACVGPCPAGYTLQGDVCSGKVLASASYDALTLTVQ